MKILLLGEYSNVHWTLAEGLRSLGHTVCVVSNGDFWKDYKRDVSLVRKYTKTGGLCYMLRLYSLLPKFRGYDVVQLINPMFLELKAERVAPVYRYLKKHNGKVFLDAFGMDAYWVEACLRKPRMFRYSDFNVGDKDILNDYTIEQAADWQGTPKARLNREIAATCNGIVAGLYEYFAAYREEHIGKLVHIPFPVYKCAADIRYYDVSRKVRFFIGVQKERGIYKGTDVMLRALERVVAAHPAECEMYKAESVPFEEYSRMVDECDVLLDQLYGYSPAMNALLAMSKGKVVVGGAEEECYDILGEKELRPMINVVPDEEDVYKKLEWLVRNRDRIAALQRQSIEFVEKYHHPQKVANRYLEFWQRV